MAIIEMILAVFTAISSWFIDSVNSIVPLFYTAPVGDTPGSLTFIGVVALAALGISITLMLVRLVTRFVKFK